MDFREVKAALDQSVLMILTDPNGTITYANEFAGATSQYDQEELSGRHFQDVFGKWNSGMDQVWKAEMESKKKDGSSYWIEWTIQPYRNDKGSIDQYIAIGLEITKQKMLETEAAKSHEKYRLIAENTADVVLMMAADGSFRYVSPSISALLGIEPFEMEKRVLYEFVHDEDQEFVMKDLTAYLHKKEGALQIEFRLRNHEGEFINVEAVVNVVRNSTLCFKEDDELFVVVIRDIRVRKIIEQKIYHMAYHDPLTNMPNRRLFRNRLQEEMNRRRGGNEPKLALLFIDLDNFKTINDQWGHDTGDFVLKEAARMIREALRPSDYAARLGGDEFIAMLTDVQEEADLHASIERLLQKFQSPITISGEQYQLTCSVGVAVYPEHGGTAEELISNADEAMYHVKGSGKNSYVLFNKTIESQSIERRLLENALRTGIREKQFYLEYQPKFNLSTNHLFGMEALVRWNHPDLGRIPTMTFIPLAEQTGLIVPLGEWILRESCEQAVQWQEKGYPPLVVSVNISARQLEDSAFVEKVKEILQDTKMDPACLELEVTESVFADMKHAASALQELRLLGIQVSVDDFGTGYSSLSYIKNLPIDTLKIDASFIRDIHTNEDSKAIVRAVLMLANTIGLNVIAEGVELAEHVEELKNDGLHFGQGYYFSKPLPSTSFERYLQQVIKAG